jgi:hypothetical protein
VQIIMCSRLTASVRPCRWQPLMAPAPLERRTTLFATINSVLVTLLATGLLALALARALHLDLQRCGRLGLGHCA